MHWRLHEQHRRGNDRPGNHDPGNPYPGADPVQNQVARHFEKEVTDKEHPGPEAVHRIAQTQIGHHLQFGEVDVDPVQVGGEVAEDDERHDSPGDLAVHVATCSCLAGRPTDDGVADVRHTYLFFCEDLVIVGRPWG